MAEFMFSWERQAMNGEEMPAGLPLEEQAAYQAVACLYGRHRLKLIDRERGHAEKGKIKHALDRRKQKVEMDAKLSRFHAKLLKDLEGAAADYAKNRSLEAADRMYQVVYGFLPGEPGVKS